MVAAFDRTKFQRAGKIWYDADLCLVMAASDGTKRPNGAWETYQHQRPSWPVVQAWLNREDSDGFGIICGKVSGNVEMFEIEGRAADLYDQLAMKMLEHGYADLWLRLCTGYLERTPSGGYHWLLRCPEPRKNTKLARRPSTPEELHAHQEIERAKARETMEAGSDEMTAHLATIDALTPVQVPQTLIETRGEGGFTIVAPSGGRTHPSGQPWERLEGAPATIAEVTVEERDALYAIASTFDLMPAKAERSSTPGRERAPGDPLRPGDDYNLRATWAELLEPLGWENVETVGRTTMWRRPGKSIGVSATAGRNDGDNLYVFSSSTPFETETPYSKFAAYALLHHGEDYKAAASALGKAGYGERRPEREARPRLQAPELPDAAVPTAAVEVDEEAFWISRPELQHIRDYALARTCSPWSVLGVVLARVVVATPHTVVLPPIIGSYASLNLFVALVGPSGSGKGISEAVAEECLVITGYDGDGKIHTVHAGSGEGIAHQYAHRDKTGIVRDRYALLFSMPEIDSLGSLAARVGATLLPQLRSGWSGEALGYAYADPAKRLPIAKHDYRMCVTLGVQPGRAATLLQDADGGTPQRFVWMPVVTKLPEQPPACPAPLTWEMRKPWAGDAFAPGLAVMEVPDVARQTILQARRDNVEGNADALDGHALLTRLKAAAALALLDKRQAVSESDWELSGVIMNVSDNTRQNVVAHLFRATVAANAQKGVAEGHRAVVVQETMDEAAARRVARRIGVLLAGGEMARAELRRRIAARDRAYFDDAVERLVEAGQVRVEEHSIKAV